MNFGAWTAVALLACLVREGQANIIGSTKQSSAVVAGDAASTFISIAASSSLKMDIKAVNTSIKALANSVKGLKTPGQTEDIKSAMDIIKPFAQKYTDLIYRVTGALTNLILDRTTPLADLFEQFTTIPQDLSQFLTEAVSEKLEDLKKTFGCVRVDEVLNILNTGNRKALEIVVNVEQISFIVLNSEDPGQLKSLVDELALTIKDLNDKVITFTTVLKSTVDGIEKSNKFLMTLNSKANTTSSAMNSTATQANSTAATQSINVQNKYTATQLSIRSNLTNALAGLSIFSGSEKLNGLAEDNQNSYQTLSNFLSERSTSDLADIAEYFGILGNRTAESINQTANIFIGAVNRTGLRLTDIIQEGGPSADSCFTNFSQIFSSPFKPLSTFVSSCFKKEIKWWSSIANTANDMLNLVQTNSQELSSNLGRCSSLYVNYTTSSEDYVRAKACLETNLEDFNDLPEVLKLLLQNMNQMIKQEVEASIFRMENCLATNLHEEVAGFKDARSAIEICAGMLTDCERISREDEENEMLQRYRDAQMIW